MTVRKVKGGYAVIGNKTHKRLTKKPLGRKAAIHREKQIQYFVNNKKYKQDHGRSIPIKRKRK